MKQVLRVIAYIRLDRKSYSLTIHSFFYLLKVIRQKNYTACHVEETPKRQSLRLSQGVNRLTVTNISTQLSFQTY